MCECIVCVNVLYVLMYCMCVLYVLMYCMCVCVPAVRCDVARQAQAVSSELRVEVRDLEQKLSHERQDRSDVSAGLVNR